NDMHRFESWSPWAKLDPAAKITYDGPATGVGASYAWDGNDKVGAGKMTITETTAPGSITQRLEILKPVQAPRTAHLTHAPQGDGTRVTGAMDGNNNYMAKVMSLFMSMDASVGKDFESGLSNLKQVSESASSSASAPAGSETTSAP